MDVAGLLRSPLRGPKGNVEFLAYLQFPGQVETSWQNHLERLERARRKIKEFLLVEVSDNTIRKQTQRMGEKQAHREAQWMRESQDVAWLQRRERTLARVPERLYGSLDGAQVPIGEEWRELKSLSWYRVAAVYGQQQPKAQEISYHCEIAPAQEFGRLLWATGVKRLADKAQELIFVCDGAVWIWKLVSHYFPAAIQIVDWYHACEYLTPIADAVFSQDAERQKWLQKVKDWLWEGQIQQVIQACQRYLQHGLAIEVAQRAVTYYTNNHSRTGNRVVKRESVILTVCL